MKSALLIHGIEWGIDNPSFRLAQGIELVDFEGSAIQSAYRKAVADQKIDEGEEFLYDFCVVIPPEMHSELFPCFNSPHSIISIISNLIVLTLRRPFDFASMVHSNDNFTSHWLAEPVYPFRDSIVYDSLIIKPENREKLKNGDPIGNGDYKGAILGDDSLEKIRICFEALTRLWASPPKKSRIANALDFFFYAWRSDSMLHVCINLAIVLETLFTPDTPSELSHRIAHNVCRFCGEDEDERESLFELIKKFYGLRSKLVHGAILKDKDRDLMITMIPEVFDLICCILNKVLSDWDMVEIFGNNKKHSQLMKHWLFQ